MVARCEPIGPDTLERSAQLVNKSNQFNLTTRRYPASEVLRMSRSPEWVTRAVWLADRFGDNGLISVLLAHASGEDLVIDTWVMSCRVLKRGVEDFLLNHLCEVARSRGLRTLRGQYIRTERNGLVQDHYSKLGFRPAPGGEDESWWELPLADVRPRKAFIREESARG